MKLKNWFIKNYPFLVVGLAPVILFSEPILTGKAIFWGTPVLQFIPWQVTAFEQIKQGILPLWNPLNGMGAPLLANYQLALFYPPTWIMFLIYLLGGAAGLAWGQTISVAFHLAWAGCGMVLLARKLGLGKNAQTISGLAFALCGFLVTRGSFFPMIWSVSWMPWVVYGTTNIVTLGNAVGKLDIRQKVDKIILLILILTMQLLSGHAQMTWYTLLFVAVWVFSLGLKKHNLKNGLIALGVFIGCVSVAFLLSAIQLLPTFEYLMQSHRAAAVNYEAAMTYSFWPWRGLTLLSPIMFGSPVQGNYWGYGNYWEDALYIGVLPLFLALGTLGALFRKKGKSPSLHRPLVMLCWITSIISTLLALGKNFFVFPFLFKYIPTFSMFQSPTRFMILAEFCLCLLAGIRINEMQPPVGKRLYWSRLGTMGAFAIALGAFLALVLIPNIKSTLIRGFAVFGFFALGSGLIILFQPKTDQKKGLWNSLLIGFVLVDLIVANWQVNPAIQAAFFKTPEKDRSSSVPNSRTFLTNSDEYTIKYKWLFRFDSFEPLVDWNTLYSANLADTNLLSASATVNNFDPIVPARFANLMEHVSELEGSALTPWLQLMDVKTLVSVEDPTSYRTTKINIDDSSRLKWFTCVRSANNESEAWEMTRDLLDRGSQSTNALILENYEGFTSSDCTIVSKPLMKWINNSPSASEVEVKTDQDGYLFIADTWYPGWKAWVDGKPVKIIRSDYNFRSIPIERGEHQVKFVYSPNSFKIGMVISLASGLFILGYSFLRKIRREKEPNGDSC